MLENLSQPSYFAAAKSLLNDGIEAFNWNFSPIRTFLKM